MKRVSLALPVILILAGCGGSASTESPAGKLAGDWLEDDGRHILRLTTTGTYAIDDGGALERSPDDIGTFSLDGETLTLTSGEQSDHCKAGDLWIWKLEFFDDDRFRGVVTVDDCTTSEGKVYTYTRCVAYKPYEGRIDCGPVK